MLPSRAALTQGLPGKWGVTRNKRIWQLPADRTAVSIERAALRTETRRAAGHHGITRRSAVGEGRTVLMRASTYSEPQPTTGSSATGRWKHLGVAPMTSEWRSRPRGYAAVPKRWHGRGAAGLRAGTERTRRSCSAHATSFLSDSAIWRLLARLSVWSCARSVRTPRSLPSRPREAVSPHGRMDHGVQRRQRDDGQAAGPVAVRRPAAARSAAWQIEKATCSASLLPLPPGVGPRLLPPQSAQGCPALACGTSYRTDAVISGIADSQDGAQPGTSHCLRGATRSAAR
jgi:hypothetical protein